MFGQKDPGDDQKGHFFRGYISTHKNQEDLNTSHLYIMYIIITLANIRTCYFIYFGQRQFNKNYSRFGNFEVSTTPAAVLRGYWSKLRDSH